MSRNLQTAWIVATILIALTLAVVFGRPAEPPRPQPPLPTLSRTTPPAPGLGGGSGGSIR